MTALMNIRGVVGLVLLLMSGILAVLIGHELGWGEGIHSVVPEPPASPPQEVNAELLPDFQLPDLEKRFIDTLERPLFVPTRRKSPPPPPPELPKPVMQKGQFRLMGTVISDDLTAAILQEAGSGKMRQVEQGRLINGIRLEQVLADRVVLTQYEDQEELRLKIQTSPAPSVRPGPEAASGRPSAKQSATPQARAGAAVSRRRPSN